MRHRGLIEPGRLQRRAQRPRQTELGERGGPVPFGCDYDGVGNAGTRSSGGGNPSLPPVDPLLRISGVGISVAGSGGRRRRCGGGPPRFPRVNPLLGIGGVVFRRRRGSLRGSDDAGVRGVTRRVRVGLGGITGRTCRDERAEPADVRRKRADSQWEEACPRRARREPCRRFVSLNKSGVRDSTRRAGQASRLRRRARAAEERGARRQERRGRHRCSSRAGRVPRCVWRPEKVLECAPPPSEVLTR